jgi:exodeoxyribonuclease III
MKIISWNVNGLRAALKKGFVDWAVASGADVICLQETKVSEEPIEIKLLEGFNVYSSCATKKGYSGVMLLSKKKPLSVSKGLGIEKFDAEGRTLIADYGDFVLFNVYFPNGKMSKERLDFKMGFYDAFLEQTDRLRSEGRNIVFCGDVNTAHMEIDLARPKENSKISGFLPEERAWMDKVVEHGYVDTFRAFDKEPGQYTWWDLKSGARARNVGWRIDYFFVNKDLMPKVKSSYISKEVMGSDHCPIGLELDVSP